MLRYLSTGQRQFGKEPMYIHKRPNWEFFAVVKGRAAAQLQTGETPELKRRHLWLFSPDVAHGWVGDKSEPCHIAVFHFSTIPRLLQQQTHTSGHLAIPLSPIQCQRVLKTAAELKPHYERMTEKGLLICDLAMLNLSLMLLDHYPVAYSIPKNDYILRKVEACQTWYIEHMAQRPKLDEVASAVNVSVRHLRRIFHEAQNESPQTVFTRLRLQRAMELLAQTDLKLDMIAYECGFASGSDFSRVFKMHRHSNPNTWRRNAMRKCAQPQQP